MEADFSLPDAETIRRTAQDIVQRPEYQLDPVRDRGTTILDLLLELFLWLARPFVWLFEALAGIPEWLRWLIVLGLLVLLVALVVHIGYTVVTAMRAPRQKRVLRAESLRRSFDPEILERQADEAAAHQDFIMAIRLLFRACLIRLARTENREWRPGLTNREHLRRYRDTPVFDAMQLFVTTIDTRWYGMGTCGQKDYDECLQAHLRIRELIKEGIHAQSA